MKRTGHLYEKMLSDENLAEAIDTVNKSHRWNHYPDKPNKVTLWVEATKTERIKELREIIEAGFVPSPFKEKERYDANAKKWRKICEPRLWPDQYVHHAMIQVMKPTMMRGMDNWCCGSIEGRGAHYGVKAIKKWMARGKEDKEVDGEIIHGNTNTHYCAELDIRHFYDSLDPRVVMGRLRKLFKDHRLLDLVWRVIKDGIKIGAYYSQWFANVVLQELDHAIREKCKGVKHFIRYMDNFTVFSNRKRSLHKVITFVRIWLAKHGLKLKDNWQVFDADKRMPNALGYRYGRGYTLVRKNTLLRIKRQLRQYYKRRESGKIISLHFAQGLLSRLGTFTHCNSTNIIKKYVKPKTQKQLKDIVRFHQRKETKTWSMYLEQYKEQAA